MRQRSSYAFIVRMCLIPALLYLMGEKAWWLPGWLDRLLPNIDIEGEALHRPHARFDTDPFEGEADPELVGSAGRA